MPQKNERPAAKHIKNFLKKNEGTGYRFTDISKKMYDEGWRHNASTIIANLRYLVENDEIAKLANFYGIPKLNGSGEKVLVINVVAGQKATIKVE